MIINNQLFKKAVIGKEKPRKHYYANTTDAQKCCISWRFANNKI